MAEIFCVEDDGDILELIEYTLRSADFNVKGFECASDFFDALRHSVPSLVLLDVMLPDVDGFEILRKMRHNPSTSKVPVIMLTAKSGQMDKIKGLDLGADDYITKPFDILELISRVKALLRRSDISEQPAAELLTYKEIALNSKSRTVTVSGSLITLTFKEFELLRMLLSECGTVIPREKLILGVWDSDFEGESRTLDVHIRTLRHKLGDAGSYIETVRNVGYKVV
ncbi:MAG: response regulator transcription factor [Bacillota bacterium]|nr:response regulator transcription factor [Bacillota bacterium]